MQSGGTSLLLLGRYHPDVGLLDFLFGKKPWIEVSAARVRELLASVEAVPLPAEMIGPVPRELPRSCRGYLQQARYVEEFGSLFREGRVARGVVTQLHRQSDEDGVHVFCEYGWLDELGALRVERLEESYSAWSGPSTVSADITLDAVVEGLREGTPLTILFKPGSKSHAIYEALVNERWGRGRR